MLKEEIKQSFKEWWKRENNQRPLIKLVSRKDEIKKKNLVDLNRYIKKVEDKYLSPEVSYYQVKNMVNSFDFHADAFPYINLNLGPGSMAAYLKSEPKFNERTVWYEEVKCESISELTKLSYENSTKWFEIHFDKLKKVKELAGGEFEVAIPDIVENIDIVSALRGPQNLCFDIYDNPKDVKKVIDIVDESYFKYYDPFYELLKLNDNSSVYTAFSIWGEGKTAKIQCDFSVMISPDQFNEFVMPSLRKQCKGLDNILYHLDGKDAIRHIDSILSIDKINAINWTPGDGQIDGGDEKWYPLYDKIIEAGKGIWIGIGQGSVDRWIDCAKKIVNRYGTKGLYFLFGVAKDSCEAERILKEMNY